VRVFALVAVLVGMLNNSRPLFIAHERDGLGFARGQSIGGQYREVTSSQAHFLDWILFFRDPVEFAAKRIASGILAYGPVPSAVVPRYSERQMKHTGSTVY
jgi:hypothetical protein